jgi:hypothetical protein
VRSSLRRLSLVALAALLAGCGAAAKVSAPRAASGPCRAAARAAVARAAGAATARARVSGVQPGVAGCVYVADAVRADVTVDSNPQAAFRFDRAVVERDQNALWSHDRSRAPRLLTGIGQGADWFPADRELLATDGRRLISVKLVHGGTLRLGRALARITLARAR